MTTATEHPFAQRLAQLPDSRLLRADQPTGTPLMCMPEVEVRISALSATGAGWLLCLSILCRSRVIMRSGRLRSTKVIALAVVAA